MVSTKGTRHVLRMSIKNLLSHVFIFRFSDPSLSVAIGDHNTFKGDEKDLIVLMLPLEKSFFELKFKNAMLVALTRAKRCLIICGNFNSDNVSQMLL